MTSGTFGNAEPQEPQPEENIPASVRSAPDLSQMSGADTQRAAGQPTAGGAQTYRRDVTTTEQFQEVAQISGQGPVIFALFRGADQQAVDSVRQLEQFINQAGGRLLLAAVDIDQAPEIAQAFQAQSSLTVVAMLGGRPAPMYDSPVPADQVQALLSQVLQLAQQAQITGTFEPVPAAPESTEPAPLPPLHQKAQDAMEQGDYSTAADAYREALRDKPADHDAKIGLARVELLARVDNEDLAQAREAAASNPEDIEAQLTVADLDVTGGHVEDAFNRLIRLIQRSDAQTKDTVRERLLDLFEVVGAEDERVVKARGALMRALF
ncbi:tetratricopeptide repeat protein [Kocuria sp. TGY1127_2]|uniref:tetratricopeptide repeat protein n=1 Tax=Kocuria sp. TGY1127_2 TaxID=2711328 RepID=UPI0015B814ED|nr:tetratricopeptide repeat protein [Kocuria sp. TGY1127_2]